MTNTKALAFRLTARDLANLAAIRKAEPYLSQTGVIRLALQEAAKKRKAK